MIKSVSVKFRQEEIDRLQRVRETLNAISLTGGITRHGLIKLAIQRGLEAMAGDVLGTRVLIQGEPLEGHSGAL